MHRRSEATASPLAALAAVTVLRQELWACLEASHLPTAPTYTQAAVHQLPKILNMLQTVTVSQNTTLPEQGGTVWPKRMLQRPLQSSRGPATFARLAAHQGAIVPPYCSVASSHETCHQRSSATRDRSKRTRQPKAHRLGNEDLQPSLCRRLSSVQYNRTCAVRLPCRPAVSSACRPRHGCVDSTGSRPPPAPQQSGPPYRSRMDPGRTAGQAVRRARTGASRTCRIHQQSAVLAAHLKVRAPQAARGLLAQLRPSEVPGYRPPHGHRLGAMARHRQLHALRRLAGIRVPPCCGLAGLQRSHAGSRRSRSAAQGGTWPAVEEYPTYPGVFRRPWGFACAAQHALSSGDLQE